MVRNKQAKEENRVQNFIVRIQCEKSRTLNCWEELNQCATNSINGAGATGYLLGGKILVFFTSSPNKFQKDPSINF